MGKREFLLLLDELLEIDPGTLTGTERLDDLGAWDSVSVVGFLALADERFGVTVPPQRIEDAKTVNDLAALLGGHVSA